jgi:hypothetical protein
VASVRAQTLAPREIIVVIDWNEDLLRLAREQLSEVAVVENRHQRGLSGGRQTGAEHATGGLLAFLDDDAIADRQWLEQLAGAYSEPLALGAGGCVEPLWVRRRPRWFPPEYDWVVGCSYAGMPARNARIRNPIGANMSVRAEVLARVGFFEPRLGRTVTGGLASGTAEETEFAIRATAHYPGGYWTYLPDARVRHVVPANRSTWSYFTRRCRVEGAAKAILTTIAGAGDGLKSERRYVCSVLPRALVRELGLALRGEPDGILRAAVMVVGVLITGSAYARQRAFMRLEVLRGGPGSREPAPGR